MSQDAFGNYIADVHDGGQNSTITSGLIGQSDSAPDASTPLFYFAVVDKSTGNVYVNPTGTPTGWQLVSAGTGQTQVFSHDGDPNGVVSATGAAICLGTGSTDGAVWVKTSAGANNNTWTNIIAAP